MKRLFSLLLLTGLSSTVHAQSFNRVGDVMTGMLVSTPVALATHKPWIGLVAGLATAGIDDGYKMHDSSVRMSGHTAAYHMSLIGVGALAGYGIGKWERHLHNKQFQREQHDKYWYKE